MKGSKTSLILMCSGLFFGAALLVCGGLLYLINQQASELEIAITEVSNLNATERAGVALVQLADETVRERETLAGYVLTRSEVPDFVTFLETFITRERVTMNVTSLNAAAAKKGEQYGSLVVAIDLKGSRSDVLRVFEMLETLPQHSYVSQTNLTQSFDPKIGRTMWNSDVVLNVTLDE